MISYLIWNGSAELFSIGRFTLRWNALLLVLAFLICRQIHLYFYKKENKPQKDAHTLTVLLVVAALVGARLGHVIFYQPELIWLKPLKVFLPFEFQPFRLTSMTGFSVHGAALVILIVLWFFGRKNKPGQQFLQILDRIVIIAAFFGALMFIGSFLNSQIVGKPTNSPAGTVFIKHVTKGLLRIPCCIMRNPEGENPLDLVIAKRGEEQKQQSAEGHRPVLLYLFFKPGVSEKLVNEFLIGDVKAYLYEMSESIYEPGTDPLHFTIFVEKNNYIARVMTIGIARYPVQLFESICCLFLFGFLFWYWNKHKVNTAAGRLFGYFMIIFWSLHFMFEYLKEYQVSGMAVTMQPSLNISLILIGFVALILSYRKIPERGKQKNYTETEK